VSEANQINLKKEKLKLDHIQQFYLSCNKDTKIDFVKDIIDSCKKKTQTIIFVNSRKFAEILFNRLNGEEYPVTLIFGGMENKERDEMI
jgi:superfamily II DNA/RNA helicase